MPQTLQVVTTITFWIIPMDEKDVQASTRKRQKVIESKKSPVDAIIIHPLSSTWNNFEDCMENFQRKFPKLGKLWVTSFVSPRLPPPGILPKIVGKTDHSGSSLIQVSLKAAVAVLY
jgi:hypothetical protein